MVDELEWAWALATSAGLGLLVGLERERNPLTKAGLRTFALIAVMGCLSALVGGELGSPWIVAVAMLLVGGAITAASVLDPATKPDDSGTTTILAALVVFSLGVLAALGHLKIAVAVGITTTVLLYFKTELEGFSQKLTPQDLRSMLRFAVISAVVLPLLPDRPLMESGPLAAISPYNVWLMVVLISGVSLAGYVAWRLTLGRHGLIITGILGGAASSTATTLVAARHAGRGAAAAHAAITIIALANATMLVRVIVVVFVVAGWSALAPVAMVLAPALLLAFPAIAYHWRAASSVDEGGEEGPYRNPANLRTAVGFAALYAVVLAVAAWLGEFFGTQGLYALAAVSGFTDVDAITLSVLRLSTTGSLDPANAAAAIAVAVAANLVAKAGFVYASGGRSLGNRTALAFLLPLAALVAGVFALD